MFVSFQAIKVADFFWYIFGGDEGMASCRKWLFVDFLYCAALMQLRIPRLTYSKAVVLLQIVLLWFFDGLMFGGISLNVPLRNNLRSSSASNEMSSTPEVFSLFDYIAPLSFGLISSSGQKDAHLIGQHTVRMSPISTAQLNPQALSFCLSPPHNFVLIPVLLNNTNVAEIQYSITPLGNPIDHHEKPEIVVLTSKDLKAIEQERLDALHITRPPPTRESDEYDEYDDDDDMTSEHRNTDSLLQNSQSLVHLRLSKPGIIHLESVFDHSRVQARLSYSSPITIVPCPSVEFVDNEPASDNVRCSGEETDLQLMIKVHGVPPLSLRWLKTINGRREHFLVEGIENNDDQTKARPGVAQELRLPLTISLDTPGTYVYALEEIVDSVGNTIRVGSETSPITSGFFTRPRTTRSLVVLRRPTVSFKHCGPGVPTSLLIGNEVPLSIGVNDSDEFDAPWEVSLKYQPPVDTEGAKPNKRYKPWKKTLKTQGNRRELSVRANAPGDYTITGVKGKWCPGDVLAPDSCNVVEKPLPTAEIEWKRIHECSGDTGVSASLILRGTPPFQVYYRMQRDDEPVRELSKTFATSRGELTLQPERSGHYKFSFTQLSDTHYKKVELNGPSIDQVIHPLAGADFVFTQAGSKRKIRSCNGNAVAVEVELRGTGPWNLEMQVVGPRSSENIMVEAIETPRKTIQIAIPKGLHSDSETFEINIGQSPTAKFYGTAEKRHVTVLEHEPASLPLRLTGEGPWRIKYRQVGDPRILTRSLAGPNDNIITTQRGVYEILEVSFTLYKRRRQSDNKIQISDSHCPGSIVADGSTYEVKWTPRPSAKLSPQTKALYEAHNGSYILPTVCEGTVHHVDLDLKGLPLPNKLCWFLLNNAPGRPPFQIKYNIAQNDNGGTRVLDQPTFNSIQPRTRFQLQTTNRGRMYYEVKQIGDANYPLANHKNAVIPRSERLLFEQEIAMRPSARFKNRNRMSYCLNDAFTPLDSHSSDGTIILDGTPPFSLKLSIKNPGTSHVDTTTIEVYDYTWKVDLAAHIFKSIGPRLVTIESVQDASMCAPTALDPLSSSIWVDVVETAAIIPFDRRVDYCVGEVTQFQLEGTPPWNIGYRINGKSYTHEAKVSPFSLIQQQPGEFTITSIAHQQKLCKAVVADLHFSVHPLPSAQVGHGKRIFQDIHEGDQAEIVFTLIGEPPFTFTYQRSEPSPKKGGKPGKVLETHTISRVTAHEYSVFSALEGTWTVTSISDRYCRYPNAQPDLGAEKQ
ncbi:hypothetical protein H0H81_011187 [Sphagnurus paluster]|uniref:Uncharacterized protein n=1 Tax=Sphagnurus paluster TaxID=117069 RepID=A0A9P7KHM4_9AGAR|nr:hypothetical protein H0H81_011187 [Sphagnurus paluster]